MTLPVFPDDFFDTEANRLNVSLSASGYHVLTEKSICNNCKHLDPHPDHPTWYNCKDSLNNPRLEWPAFFDGETPVACARKEE